MKKKELEQLEDNLNDLKTQHQQQQGDVQQLHLEISECVAKTERAT